MRNCGRWPLLQPRLGLLGLLGVTGRIVARHWLTWILVQYDAPVLLSWGSLCLRSGRR
jgi:hypothetical protein